MGSGYGFSKMICAPLMAAQSAEQMLNDMHRAKMEGADVVEITLDFITNNFHPQADLKFILQNKPIPVVIALQPTLKAGQYKGDEKERLQVLRLARDLGADYIELGLEEAYALGKEEKSSNSKIIVSYYLENSTTLKEDFGHLVVEMQSAGADIIKFVSSPSNITEIANIFDTLSNSEVPIISYCKGERGLVNQLLSFKYGGVFAYGFIEGNEIPGLPSIDDLVQAYRIKNTDKNTKVIGLVSKPVSHSKGPLLHNPTFRHVAYNGIYVPMLVDDLNEFFRVYSTPDFSGFSVGIPYKEAIVDFCDEVHPLAQTIGAVNTIVRRPNDGKLVGYNTDCEAAILAIEDALQLSTDLKALIPSPLSGKSFVLVGAGGAGRALAFGAKIRGARVIIFDIDFDRAKSLAGAVSGEALPFDDLLSFEPEKDAILANATPLGMHPNTDRIPVPEERLRDYKLVFDAVYNPRKTRLLKEAEAAGALIVSGVEMFIRQAAAQFELFTRQKAPEEFMRGIIMEKF